MTRLTEPLLLVGLVYAALCVGLWPLPLLGLLHAESAAVVAGIGFFASGLAALALFRRGMALGPVLVRLGALLAVPWGLLTLSLLWRPNCGYGQGLLLFLTFAVPSVALAVALAFWLDAAGVRWRRTAFVLIGLGVAVLPVLYDLGLHPQVYTYNHVWGGVLGPVYDEELAVRPGLFFFRGLTLWWAVWLVLLGRRAGVRRDGRGREEAGVHPRGWALLGVSAVIALTYAAAPWLGINTPGWVLKQELGGHLATERFDIHYDPEETTPAELTVIADAHRYRYHQLREALGVDVPVRTTTYLYPDAATKAALTGARQTSVVPVWLPTPQVHLLEAAFEGSFAHELAHVVSREFGMPVLRASPAVGLVEGLAAALEPPEGLPPLHDQVAAGLLRADSLGVYPDGLAAAVAAQLSPFGFWTGRGAVSYTTMGSFVRYLLDAYGPAPLRRAYATADFEGVYGKPASALAAEWEAFIRDQVPDAEAERVAGARFSRASLFERRCPHWIPPAARHARAGEEALRDADAEAASAAFAAALRADSTYGPALAGWARLALARGEEEGVIERLKRARPTLGVAGTLRLGDAHRLGGDAAEADSAYGELADAANLSRSFRAAVALRRELSPEALRVLLAVEPPEARAARLEGMGPEAAALAALLWMEAGGADRALATLERAPTAALPGVAAERASWLAGFAHAAGEREVARLYAEDAAGLYAAAGAPYLAARERDRAEMLAWLSQRRPLTEG